jgi:hypothetical protein
MPSAFNQFDIDNSIQTTIPILPKSTKAWPENVRAFPKSLLISGAFLAITSKQTHANAHSTINVAGNPNEKSKKERRTSYECVSPSRSIKHFMLLLELIDICKYMNVGQKVEFSPGKMLDRLGIKSSGTAYQNLERLLCDLAGMTFINNDALVEEESVGFFSGLETSKFTMVNGKMAKSPNNSRVWSFTLSPFLCHLISHDDLSTVHQSIIKETGRSPILQWTYLFYSTHGSNAGNIYEYNIKTLSDISGLSQRSKLLTQAGKAKEAIKTAMRELEHRIRKALVRLRDLKIFQSIKIERSAASNLLSVIQYKSIVKRYSYEIETKLSRTPLISRTPPLPDTSPQ